MEKIPSIKDLIGTLIELQKEYYLLHGQYIQLKSISNNNYKYVPILQNEQSNDRDGNDSTYGKVVMESKVVSDTTNSKHISKLHGEVTCSRPVQDRIKSFHSALNNIINCKIKSEEKDAYLNNLEENFDMTSSEQGKSLIMPFPNISKKI